MSNHVGSWTLSLRVKATPERQELIWDWSFSAGQKGKPYIIHHCPSEAFGRNWCFVSSQHSVLQSATSSTRQATWTTMRHKSSDIVLPAGCNSACWIAFTVTWLKSCVQIGMRFPAELWRTNMWNGAIYWCTSTHLRCHSECCALAL